MNWYDKNIEKPILHTIKLLRDNGFNTESSCGHEMEVQCQYIPEGELQRLHSLLFNNGHRNYEINVTIRVTNGTQFPTLNLTLKGNRSDDDKNT